MHKTWLLSLSLLSFALTAACDKPAVEATAKAPAAAAPGSPKTEVPTSQPAVTATAAAPTGAPSAGGLTWSEALPFVRRAPKNSMRAAEYGIEGEERAELSVFYFGPDQGDVVEPNVTRWLGQFKQPDGSDTAAKAKRSERKVTDIKVSMVEAEGMFSGGMGMPGAPAPEALPDAMLLGAIAQGPKGSVFFKLVGPKAAVEGARTGLQAMLDSLHAE